MTQRRPGAPRRAGRPVAPSVRGDRAAARRGTRAGSRSGRPGTRPADAARRRSTAAPSRDAPAATDSPVRGLTRRSLVLLGIIVVALATLLPTLNHYVSQQQQLSAAQRTVAQQEVEVQALQKDVDRWDDPTFVAAQARERLLFAMPGETQYRLTDTSGREVPLTEDEKQAEAARQEEWFDALWTSVEGASRLEPEDIPSTTSPADGATPSADPSASVDPSPTADPSTSPDQ